MVRRPRPADGHFAILQLLGCSAIAVLIFFQRLIVDEIVAISMSTPLQGANFFLQLTSSSSGLNRLMYLNRECAGLGLALAVSRRLYAQFRKIVATHCVGQNDVDHRLAKRAVGDGELDMHLALAAKLGHADAESTPIDPNCLPKRVITLEDGSESERKNWWNYGSSR